jgi:hypothetical protein
MNTVRYAFAGRRWGLIFFMIFAQCSVLAGSQYEQEKRREGKFINWDEVKQALDVYESCPSEESARRLLATIPEKPAVYQLGKREATALAFLNSVPFEKAVISGDKLLAETAFKLLGYVGGGAVDEELRIMLGRFLIREPATFLELLKRYNYLFPSERDYPIFMTEILEIVPDITSEEDGRRQKKERVRLYTERIKALERVKEPGLIELRDACIRAIQTIVVRIERRAI